MIVYLSGPMRGHPNFNFPAFDEAAQRMCDVGIRVYNPAAHDRELYPDIEQWEGFETGDPEKCPKFNLPNSLRWDFNAILEADAIVMLPGWSKSAGARAERFVAECVGTPVLYYHGYGQGMQLTHDALPVMQYPNVYGDQIYGDKA